MPETIAERLRRAARCLARDESGASAIEYAIIASLIFLVIVSTLTAIGPKLSAIFTNAATNM
jgi:pilus assembly protein Flp/PilA